MKKVEKSKVILGIILSIVIILALSNFSIVRADDDAWPTTGSSTENATNESNSTGSLTTEDDPFLNLSDENWSTPATENTANNTTNDTSNQVSNSSNETNNVVNVTNTITNTNNNTNSVKSTTSNSNSLAKTGIADSNGMFAVILIVCGIVAVYSFKKVSDYKNM